MQYVFGLQPMSWQHKLADRKLEKGNFVGRRIGEHLDNFMFSPQTRPYPTLANPVSNDILTRILFAPDVNVSPKVSY